MSDREALTRRDLLAGAGVVAAAVGSRSLLPPAPRRPGDPFPLGSPEEPLALVPCDSYAEAPLTAALERVLELAPPPAVRGRRVVLKPNFVEFHPDRPVTTHLELLRLLVARFRDLGARSVVVAEGPGHRRDTAEVWGRSGLLAAAREDGFELVDLNYDPLVRRRLVPLRGPPSWPQSWLAELWLPRTVVEADLLVSVPKLKTHHWAGLTLAAKNLFGVVPGVKYGWPKNLLHFNGIPRSILELATNVPVGYCLVDGVVAMEGDGPIMGTAVDAGLLMGGRNPFAVDWVGARLVGFEPTRVPHLELAAGLGVLEPGGAEPVVTGESVRALGREFAVLPRFESLRG